MRVAARVAARPVEESVRPIVEWIESPPQAPLTADDRGKPVPLDLASLDPDDARRLAAATADLLAARGAR
jgi:hypothetical protein